MSERYDLTVIGAGMGGINAAFQVAGAVMRVALIERHKPRRHLNRRGMYPQQGAGWVGESDRDFAERKRDRFQVDAPRTHPTLSEGIKATANHHEPTEGFPTPAGDLGG